jgi:hypothetical protein
MKKLFYIGALIATSFWSCRPEVNPEVKKPTADSFSPGIAKTGDTVSVIGSSLKDSKILINGREVQIITNTDGLLSFPVTNALTNPNALPKGEGESIYTLEVLFKDGSSTKFSQSILLNHVVGPEDFTWLSNFKGSKAVGDTLVKGPKQLLITDFDGHGIRTANATDRFDQTQWTALVKTGGSQSITGEFLGVKNPPSKGNFFATQLNPEFLTKNTFGFAAEFVSATDVLNNRKDSWSNNFSEIPESPISYPNASNLKDLYFNFYVYKNSSTKGTLRAYLYNNNLSGDKEYANSLNASSGNFEWVLVSVPFTSFKANYGSGSPITADIYKEINKIKFVYTHSDWANNGNKVPTGDVQFYLDHIIITQGSPYITPPIN